MRFVKFYTAMAIVVGCLEVVDGVKLSLTTFTAANETIALVEMIWILVSIYAVIVFWDRDLSIMLPAAYLLYHGTVIGWGVANGYHQQKVRFDEIPSWVAISGAVFGLFYAAAGAWFIVTLLRKSRTDPEPRP